MSNWYRYGDFESAGRIRRDDGIKAQSKSGKFAKSWWAQRWIAALERLVDAGRLRRGRSYARSGQVLGIEEVPGGVAARVQGSRRTPYKVKIRLKLLSDAQWEQVIDKMAAQAIFAAQLLAGEMPQDIEEAFAAAGVSLFPSQKGDLETECSCPDWANPCKHVAATHYILGEQLDADPFLLFRLRGRSQEQILEGLRVRRSMEDDVPSDREQQGEVESVVPLDEQIDTFWEAAERLQGVRIEIKPPVVRLPVLKRLGPPTFLAESKLTALLGPAYEAMTAAALAAAFEDGAEGEPEE